MRHIIITVALLFTVCAVDPVHAGRSKDMSGHGTVFASAARTTTATSSAIANPLARGAVLWLDVTVFDRGDADETMDCKVQIQDPVSANYTDLGGAAWAQIASASATTVALTVYPGIAETANVSVSDVLPDQWRVVCTIAGTSPSATFSIGYDYIP